MNCQSCQGTGRLPRSQQQELVALIPYDDDRLKPKRTALWVTMGVVCAIFACGLVAGSLVYILVPRTVVVEFIPPIRNNVTFTRQRSNGPLNNYNFYERNLGQEKQKDLLTVVKHKRDSHEFNNSTSCC